MLTINPQRGYEVYAPWSDFSYRWEDLPRLLARPLNSMYLDPTLPYRDYGFPDAPQSFELLAGPVGGGIVVRPVESPGNRWLAGLILGKEANTLIPEGLRMLPDAFAHNVFWLEPRDEPGVELGLGKRAKYYAFGVSIDHAEAAGEHVYWAVRYRRGKTEATGIDELATHAKAFGIRAARMSVVPDALRIETDPWFVPSDFDYAWFEIESESREVGHHLATATYFATHLAERSPRRKLAVHLIAQVEGKPVVCRKWRRPK